MNQQLDEMRLYFNRVRPMCRELFAMAYVICADYDDAEYVLQKVIINCWHGGRKRRSVKAFRESLRDETRHIAIARAKNDDDWDQFGAKELDGIPDDPVLAAFQKESVEMRRLLMLRYGCRLSNSQIGKILDISGRRINQLIAKFQKKLKRTLDPESRAKLDTRLYDVCNEQLVEHGAEMPDIGALYRTFEAEASAGYSQVGHVASRIVSFIAAVLLLIAVACVMWGVSAIIRPAQIEDSGLLTETLNEQ